MQRKDERIAELEAHLSSLSKNNTDKESQSVATAMSPLLVCPQCLRGGQGSSSEGGASSPMATTTRRISSSDRLAMVPNLSPIEERGDGVFSQLSCDDGNASGVTDSNRAAGGNERKSGNHSNKTTPRRRKISVLDREQQEVEKSLCLTNVSVLERCLFPPSVAGCHSDTGLDNRGVGAGVVVRGEAGGSTEGAVATHGGPEQEGPN